MKPNTLSYVLYGIYGVALAILLKYIIFNHGLGLLTTLLLWFGIPLLIALVPIILIKRYLLQHFVPKITAGNDMKIAVHGTLTAIIVPIVYMSVLALLLSLLTIVGAQSLPILGFNIPQNKTVIVLELMALSTIFAWISRFVEFHVVWPMVKKENKWLVQRALLYGNIIGYVMLTVVFVAWQLGVLFRLAEHFGL